MYTSVSILVLGLTIAGARANPTDEVLKNCFHVFHPGSVKCCKSLDLRKEISEVQECLDMKKGPRDGPPPCDMEICMAKKLGYLGSDGGTANKAALKQRLENEMAGKPELLAAVTKDCVDGDITKYGPPEGCELFKIKNCIQVHALQTCEEWDDKGHCSDVKGQVEDCMKVVSK